MINDGPATIDSVLKEKHKIPKYQREYAWGRRQVVELWADVCEYNCCRDSESKYIFGQIIVYKSSYDKNEYIIDGQQRLTTSYLFIAAARKIIELIYPDKNERTKTVERYLNTLEEITFEIKDQEDVPRLSVNKVYKDTFNDILQLGITEIDVNSDSNLISAYSILLRELYAFSAEKESKIDDLEPDDYSIIVGRNDCFERVKSIIDCFLSFSVVYISVNKLSDAYRIFDSVNTRGMRLNFTDLVKNYFFTRCYSSDQELQDDDYGLEDSWRSIVSDINDDFSKFFRYVLIAKYGMIRDEEIMAVIKEKINDPKSIKHFIQELRSSVKIYIFITKKTKMFETEESNRIINGITSAKKSMTFYAPLLISFYLRSLNEGDSKDLFEYNALKLIKAIDTSLVRGLFADKNSNYYEEDFATYSKQYYNDEVTLDVFIGNIYSKSYSDAQLSSLLKTKDWSNDDARYILTELYNRMNPTNVVKNETDVEHIMPKDIEKIDGWAHIDLEVHKENVNKIGNLILLEKRANRGLKNKSFEEKLIKYNEKRGLLLDNYLDNVLSTKQWNEDSISERTSLIIGSILEMWPVAA